MAVPGLLQTGEYARRLINGYRAIMVADPGELWAETAAAISLRARRQERLYDLNKTFEFTIMESVLANRLAPPGYMHGQVERLEQAAALPNVTIRIVPQTADLELPPLHGFMIFDTDAVMTETLDAMIFRDRRTIDFYTHFFDAYAEHTVAELEPILQQYKMMYASMALTKES
jgi:hypothetical protein